MGANPGPDSGQNHPTLESSHRISLHRLAMDRRIVLGVMALMLGGCGSKPARTSAVRQPSATVIVLVAASAQEAVGELAERFRAENGVDVRVVADDSAK